MVGKFKLEPRYRKPTISGQKICMGNTTMRVSERTMLWSQEICKLCGRQTGGRKGASQREELEGRIFITGFLFPTYSACGP